MQIYLGTFLIAFATLALEVSLTRILSVVTWYHMAFFAISTAMLGMTAGATWVYLRSPAFEGERLPGSLAKACVGYALAVPVALVLICLLPLEFTPSLMSALSLLLATVACSLPFFFSGIAVTAVLTRTHLPTGSVYASDLLGASFGCLLVLWGLEVVDAPSLVLLTGALGLLAALSYARGDAAFRHRRTVLCLFLVYAAAVPLNASSELGIRPLVVKGRFEYPWTYFIEKWNSYSRVVVYKLSKEPPQYWGRSKSAPRDIEVNQYLMNIDGSAATTVQEFRDLGDIDHLRYDITNVAYYLRPVGGACIIGVGGGRDVQSALLFGHDRVLGVELNPIFVGLHRGQFRDFSNIANREGVTLVADEARSYLSRTSDQFSVLQMSLVDTWAATGAGAYSLSENALYTVEAWKVFLDRLADDGVFTVSRWFNPQNLGETARLTSLAVASQITSGVEDPSAHIALLTAEKLCTLILSKQPLSDEDIAKLKKVATDLQYEIAIRPGRKPKHPILRRIVAARSESELERATADPHLNFSPPTDERPYFFNMLPLGEALWARPKEDSSVGGMKVGNLRASRTLRTLILCLLALVAATVVVPLLLRARTDGGGARPRRVLWSGAVYFMLIGAGFMFAEIGMIQRLSVFLGHPVYALGVILFAIIASTGVGSFLSERLPLTRPPWLFVYPVVAAVGILALRFVLAWMLGRFVTQSILWKIVLSVLAIFPLGILLGFFFPTGMRLLRAVAETETPWYWALNGIFGVLCSAVAVFVAIYFGISMNFYLAAAFYLGVLACVTRMWKRSSPADGGR